MADNSVMWVYFNVPEKYYLHYMATRDERENCRRCGESRRRRVAGHDALNGPAVRLTFERPFATLPEPSTPTKKKIAPTAKRRSCTRRRCSYSCLETGVSADRGGRSGVLECPARSGP